jgi:hypothetical protein
MAVVKFGLKVEKMKMETRIRNETQMNNSTSQPLMASPSESTTSPKSSAATSENPCDTTCRTSAETCSE